VTVEMAIVGGTRPWTAEDLLALPDDIQRYEIVDGSLLVSPPPSSGHQRAASRLHAVLAAALPPDREALEGIGVQAQGSVLVPDLAVVRAAAVRTDPRPLDAADVFLVVEITSPSSLTADRVAKPALYAGAGIPAYWRVELSGSGTPLVALHRLTGDVYREEAVVHTGEHRDVSYPAALSLEPAILSGSSG
jgi:Uma2 family endonuclease